MAPEWGGRRGSTWTLGAGEQETEAVTPACAEEDEAGPGAGAGPPSAVSALLSRALGESGEGSNQSEPV